MFFAKRPSRLGLGMVMGSMLTLAAVGAAVCCYTASRRMAEKLYRKGKRKLSGMGLLP